MTQFNLPPGLTLMLGDVKEGSNSPKMASKLMKWKSENQDLCTFNSFNQKRKKYGMR